jgi:hypothetical protein
MTNPFVQSLKDQMNALDFFIGKIWTSFTDMLLKIIEYIKYFLEIGFGSLKYILACFGFIFILIILFSKEKKENLYVLLYFFIGITMASSLAGIIYTILYIIVKVKEITKLIKETSQTDRHWRQRVSKGFQAAGLCFAVLFLILALFFILFGLSFLYSIEIHLYDVINQLFRGKD